MKNLIPEFNTKEELFSFLRINKSKLIAQKRAMPLTSDNFEFGYSKTIPVKFAANKKLPTETYNEIQLDIIANVSGWCDSQMDVMIKDNWNKSIKDIGASGQKIIYHLKNHGSSIDDIIGRDPSLFTKDIDLSVFNFKSDIKKAQALIMSSIVCQDYDGKIYNLYEDGQIKQHSIGLQYVQLLLCLNSKNEEDTAEKKNWDKYYPQVINKDVVDGTNYFWAVTEAKIFEVSAVLYGANILTPVLDISQPSPDTESEPPQGTPSKNEKQERKSIVACPSCTTLFVASQDGLVNCPGCGQYVSRQSTRVETPPFDLLAAINQTIFIKN